MKLLAFPVLVALLSGCGHQYVMPPDPRVFGDETIAIETWDGQWHNAKAVTSARGPVWDAGEEAPIDPFHVKTAVRGNMGRHVGMGAGIGALTGLLLGAGMGLASGDDRCVESDDNLCLFVFSAKEKAIFWGLAMNVVGAGVGALMGVASGTREEFISPLSDRRFAMPEVSLFPVRGGAAGGLRWTY